MTQSNQMSIGIVADDLTSATDAAAPFLIKGYAPLIGSGATCLEYASLVSLNTNSRLASIAGAKTAMAAAVSLLKERRLLLKTIDSTLRGHIHAEVVAAFAESRRKRLVIAPAFPDAGRNTVGGIQTVAGIPVSESAYALDPVHPARTSRIVDLVDPCLGSPVVLAQDSSEEAVRSSADARVLILDADSQRALNCQVSRIPDPETVLWVGAPGLAMALATLVPGIGDQPPAEPDRTCERVLIVAGSANPATHEQCAALQTAGVPVVFDLTKGPRDVPIRCLRAPCERRANAGEVLTQLTRQAAAALARRECDAVIATGGETMATILERLDISRFVLSREIEPGFPVGWAELADGTPLAIAMKAGGFGSPLTLLRAAQQLLSPRVMSYVHS
jgi:uncharacterized protein YgbK (DUF1537 family)